MDCHRILSAIARRAAHFGAEFFTSSCELPDLEIRRVGNNWSVRFDGYEFISPILILAVGPLVTRMPVAQNLIKNSEVQITRAVVGILHHRICQRILVFRDQDTNLLNVSPFAGGTSLNLGNQDETVQDPNDGDETLDLTAMNAALTEYAPGIARYPSLRAHFYYCHKIRETSPQPGQASRRYFWSQDTENGLFYFYPGKFTTAHTGVKEMLASIRAQLPPAGVALPATKTSRRAAEAMVAASPYHDVPYSSMKTNERGFVAFISQVM
jgi:hypothetical protein